ncbi:MAG: thermonuclease family protein [Alphaproteobacteria bacterium]
MAGAALATFIALIPRSDAAPREVLPGPVPAELVRVVDGDSVLVSARIWLGQRVTVSVRLAGIDAPEIRGRCDAERKRAHRAREFLVRRLKEGNIALADIHYGKYAGRVVARLLDRDGVDLGAALVKAGLARPYAGRRRLPWC